MVLLCKLVNQLVLSPSSTDDSLTCSIFKLIVSKLPKKFDHAPIELSRNLTRIMVQTSSQETAILGSKFFAIIRWIIRITDDVVDWPNGYDDELLFLELCALDSLSQSSSDQLMTVAKKIGSSSTRGDHMHIAKLFMGIMGTKVDTSNDIEIIHFILSLYFGWSSTTPDWDRFRKVCLMVKSHRESSIHYITCLLIKSHALWLIKILAPDDELRDNVVDSLTMLLNPPQVKPSTTDNRYQIARLNFDAAAIDRSKSPSAVLVHASNVLHYLKWTSPTAIGKVDFSSPISLGYLSLMVSETPRQLFESMMHELEIRAPLLEQIYMILESVRMVATSFREIGYIPGELWVLEKGVEFCEKFDSRIVGKYKERFCIGRSDSQISYDSNRIPHVSFEYLSRISQFVEMQEKYKSGGGNHYEKFFRFMNVGMDNVVKCTRVIPCGVRIEFQLTSLGSLELSFWQGNFKVYHEPVFEKFSFALHVSPLLAELTSIMDANKSGIDGAVDGSDFWAERKRLDGLVFEFLKKLEKKIFPEIFSVFLGDDHDQHPIELVLAPVLIGLPIESVPILQNRTVIRMVDSLSSVSSPQTSRMTYILNPGADCPGTEKSILPYLKSWTHGYCGHVLSDSEFSSTVSGSKIFLFSGHGGGEKHWSGSSIQRLRVSEACGGTALLMGCSSAKPYGDYSAPFCTPFHYLIGGYRLVVGTLWDVLGREMDRMTVGIVQDINEGIVDYVGLAKSVTQNKMRAKLKSLSSASIVMYASSKFSQ